MIIQLKDRTHMFPNEQETYQCTKCGEKFRNKLTAKYHKCPEDWFGGSDVTRE